MSTKPLQTLAGVLNYSMDYIYSLLGIVSSFNPLSSNYSAEVTEKYQVWAVEYGIPSRGQ